MDGVATKPVEGVDSMSKFLRVVSEAEVNQPAPTAAAPAPAASTLPPEQLAYNQLKAQIDSADALRGGGTYTDVSPEVTASTDAMRTKLAQMAAALKAKGIDAEAAYNAPDPAVAPAAPVDLNQKYASDVTESSLSKFLSIVDNNSSNMLNEGANPHKVTLPVQMAMQHYQQPAVKTTPRSPVIGKYFKQVEDELVQEKIEKRQLINQYASIIAERVRLKESKINELSNEKLGQYKKAAGAAASAADKAGDYDTGNKRFKGIVKATLKQGENDSKKNESAENLPDVIELDVPLLIRLLEYARENAQTDMDLHNVAEQLIALSSEGRTLNMQDYEAIVGDTLQERRKIKPKRKTDPCWSDYKQVGMKNKGGKQVPNCVPKR